mmetsp:Transcript_50114/g.133647  ORF Transcript_50114/g.133647 Transcript_50114/m.133647 type:complete len:123 (-) Transcript_50114:366-734(-)
MIAKRYKRMTSKHMVKKTEREAANIPLIRIISSGMDRNIRAKRESRSKRNNRKIEAPPMPEPPPEPSINIEVITQVSATIMNTRHESKTNHPSFNPSCFLLNELKRTYHSKEKYQQKRCSAT